MGRAVASRRSAAGASDQGACSGPRHRVGRSGAVALFSVGILVSGLAAPAVAATDDAPEATDSDTPRPVNTPAEQEPPVRDWTAKDESTTLAPEAVADDVAKGERVRVAALMNRDGKPEIVIRKAKGPRHAERRIAAIQADPELIAVDVDARMSINADPNPERVKSQANDARFGELWGMSLLQAEQAWAMSVGSGVVVAVVDSGVEASHPDLQGSVLTGANTVWGDSSPATTDPHGHGTHVAGTIAAHANNGVGVAGLAPGAVILPIKALDAGGSGYTSDVADGIVWATDNGAHVINLSLGGSPNGIIEGAVNYALSKGRTVVAASGNQGASSSGYPAAYPGVISVSALDTSGTGMASFSNRGANVDLAAPGQGILSTVPGGGYASYSGTSMAAPHVAAAAALVLAQTPTVGVAARLNATAADLGSPGYDATFAHGRLNVVNALRAQITPSVVAQTIKTPKKLRVGQKKRLAKTSRQGVSVKKWLAKRQAVCKVTANKKKSTFRLVGVKKGTCRVKAVLPATDSSSRELLKSRIKVKS